MNMKKCILGVLSILTLCACHESLEDRAAREAADFTKKNCPMKVSEGITIDSMVFEKSSKTLHYFYTLSGKADTAAINRPSAQKELLEAFKGDTSVRKYKEENFNFAYTYFSKKHANQKLIEVTITPKEYK